MTNTLLNVSAKIDKTFLKVFETLDIAASEVGVPYFIVGATARDMILQWGHGIDPKRATVDIDLGINVSSWDEYNHLKAALIRTGLFSEGRDKQRLQYNDADNNYPVDLVPFGDISNAHGDINWPPEDDCVMNVAGFEDAFKLAQTVRLRETPNLDVNFASPLGLSVMKILAWSQRRDGLASKDAIDLATLILNYLAVGNHDRLYREHPDLLEADNFDYDQAGAALLGRDIASGVSPITKSKITEILQVQTTDEEQSRLAQDMTYRRDPLTLETYFSLLVALRKGVTGAPGS